MNKFFLSKPLVGLLLFLGALLPLAGESTWRGQAGVSSGAGLPETGLFAATNEFPRGTVLEVRNLRNNKSLQLQVLRRSPSALDLNFIYLSSQAGRDLDIRSGESVLVSVSVLQSATVIPTPTPPVASSLTAPEGSLKPLTTLSLENRTGEPVVPVLASVSEDPETLVTPPAGEPASSQGLDAPQVVAGSLDNPRPRDVSPGTPVAAAGDNTLPADKPAGVTAPIATVPQETNPLPAVIALNEPALEDLIPLEKPGLEPTAPGAAAEADSRPIIVAATQPGNDPDLVLEVPGLPGLAEKTVTPDTVVASRPGDEPAVALDLPVAPGIAVESALPDSVVAVEPGSDPSLALDAPQVSLPSLAVKLADPAMSVAMNTSEPGLVVPELPADFPGAPVLAERPFTVTAQAQPVPSDPPVEPAPEFSVEAAVAFLKKDVPVPVVVQDVPQSVAAANPATIRDEALPLAVPAAPTAVSVEPAVPTPTTPAVTAERPVAAPGDLAKLGVSTLPRQTPESVPQRSSAGDVYVSRPSPVTADPLGDVKLVTRLDGGGDYIQLASYRSQDSLIKTLEKINSYIPLVLWVPEGTTPVYRLVAGPLRRDQLGLVFKHYQDQGFRDAFIIKKP